MPPDAPGATGRPAWPPPTQTGSWRAGLAAGAAAVVVLTVIRVELAELVGTDMALLFYVLAVLLAAALGGAVAGLTVTLLSVVAGIGFVVGPRTLTESVLEWVRVTVFLAEGVAISLTFEILLRRTATLEQTTEALDQERRVVEGLALEDPVSRLANRRAFDRDIGYACAQASRQGLPWTLAIIDIDGLKAVNDAYGHARGDRAIAAVAAALKECCRASDLAYRIGGDEFALLLSGTDRGAYDAIERRVKSRAHDAATLLGCAGVSVGAAHTPSECTDPATLVRLADGRMYEMKAGSDARAAKRWTQAPVTGRPIAGDPDRPRARAPRVGETESRRRAGATPRGS